MQNSQDTSHLTQQKKIILANLHKVCYVFKWSKVSIMKKQCWALPASLTKTQILAFYSLLLYYSNRIKYQSCTFLICLNELS